MWIRLHNKPLFFHRLNLKIIKPRTKKNRIHWFPLVRRLVTNDDLIQFAYIRITCKLASPRYLPVEAYLLHPLVWFKFETRLMLAFSLIPKKPRKQKAYIQMVHKRGVWKRLHLIPNAYRFFLLFYFLITFLVRCCGSSGTWFSHLPTVSSLSGSTENNLGHTEIITVERTNFLSPKLNWSACQRILD